MAHQAIVFKKYCHIGVAVDTPNGLLVPVIRDADRKTMTEIAGELAALSQKARDKKLSLDEMSGGVFSITNLGGIGGTSFTPIINQPEVAILGMSRTAIEPVWQATSAVRAARTCCRCRSRTIIASSTARTPRGSSASSRRGSSSR